MTSIAVETEDMKRAFAEYLKYSKRDLSAVLKEQDSLLVRDIALFTPPGRIDSTTPKDNRKGGEKTVKNDIYKIMRASGAKKAKTNPEFYHMRFRRSRGRVVARLKKGNSDNRFKIKTEVLKEYVKTMQSHVGFMAAGWNNAAKWLGRNLPAWIARHNAPGSGKLIALGDEITVELTNYNIYPQSRGLMDRVVSRSLVNRKIAMSKKVNNRIRELARETGLAA